MKLHEVNRRFRWLWLAACLAPLALQAEPGRATIPTLDAYSGKPLTPELSTYQLLGAGAPENVALSRWLFAPVSHPTSLAGKRVAVLATDGVEEIELMGNLRYFRARGAVTELVAPKLPQIDPKLGVRFPEQRATHILTVRFMENATWVKIDRFVEEARGSDYDAIIVPGGAWNPDSLRIDPAALAFVRQAAGAGKITAAICHGPLVLLNAGLLKGKRATSTWNVRLDLENAGASVLEEPVVVDGNVITSRHPLDLPQFTDAIETALHARH